MAKSQFKRLVAAQVLALCAAPAGADGPNPRVAYAAEVMLHGIPADGTPGSVAPATVDGTISVNLRGSGYVGTYTASLSCPPEIRPKDASTAPFTRQTAVSMTTATTHAFTVPNSDGAGHAATVWRCSLRVTVYAGDGAKTLDDWLPVHVVYVSSEFPELPINRPPPPWR